MGPFSRIRLVDAKRICPNMPRSVNESQPPECILQIFGDCSLLTINFYDVTYMRITPRVG